MSRPRHGPTRSPDGRPTPAAPPTRTRPSGRLPLVLGLAAALLLAIGAVAAMVMLGDREGAGPGEAGAASGQPDPGAPAPADSTAGPATTTEAGPAPSNSARPEASLPGGEPLRGGFETAPELCEAGDFSPVFTIVDRGEMLNDYEHSEPDFYQRTCVFTLSSGASQGSLNVDIVAAGSRGGAARWYQDSVAADTNRDPAQEPVDGDWDESTALVLPTASAQAEVRVLARSGLLVVNLYTFVVGDAADVDALQAALVQVAEWIRDAMRS